MDDKNKSYFGAAFVIVLFIFAYAALSYVSSYSKSIQPSSFGSFSVSAQGKITAIPDVAQFTFSVITQGGKDIISLQKENTEKANKAVAFLKAQNVDTKDIKTVSYNLEPRYQYFDCNRLANEGKICPPPEIVGYAVTQTVSVKIRDFGKIGGVLSGVVENGANSVSQLSFAIDDQSSVEGKARDEAIGKAREKAETIAKAGGFKIGRLLSIEEGFSPTPFYAFAGEETKGVMPSVPTIEPGSQEVTVNITLRYEIQ